MTVYRKAEEPYGCGWVGRASLPTLGHSGQIIVSLKAYGQRRPVLETGSGGLGEGAITPAIKIKPRSSRSTEASSRETLQYRIRISERTQIHVASIGKGRSSRVWPLGSDSHTSSAC